MFIFILNSGFSQPVSLENTATRLYHDAQNHAREGKYDLALEEHLKAVRIFEFLNDHAGLARSYNSIGLIYNEIKAFEQSRNYYNKAIAELALEPDQKLQAYVLNNLGMLVENLGENDSAQFFYERSLGLKQELQDTLGISKTYTNIGVINIKEGRFREGLNQYFKSLQLKLLLHDSVGIATAYSNIADAYGWMGLFDSTRYYLNQGMNYINQKKDLPTLSLYYRNFSALFNAVEDFESAFAYSDSLLAIEKKIFHLKLSDELARQQIMYETEKKDQELSAEKAKTALLTEKQHREKTEKTILFIILGGLLLFSVLLYYLVQMRSRQMRQNTLLFENEKKLLEAISQRAEKDKELLEKEVELKTKELIASSTLMLSKQEVILQLKEQLEDLSKKNVRIPDELLAKINETYQSSLNLEQEWERFQTHFNSIHGSFFEKLQALSADLTETDLRHSAYIRIGLTTKEIAALLNIEPSSVQKSRMRLKKKLGLTREQDLQDFIKSNLS
ncbi:MAG: tetratricopeptide repeat protein [Bacteroidetes bacterium]|nr:tetratricopeptide repeat protein [Bacteroidota bacterium]